MDNAAYRERLRPVVMWAQRNGLFFGVVILVLGFALASPHFMTRANWQVILSQVAVIGLIAVPGSMLLMAGYVDLSIGSLAVLAAVGFGEFNKSMHIGVLPAAILGVLLAAGWGVLNGTLIAYFKFSPIVVTLGGLAGARGVAEFWSKANTKFTFGSGFSKLAGATILGLDLPVWICGAAFLVGAYLWYAAPFGRHMIAVGVDRDAAQSAGIKIERIPFALYVASGFVAGVGGLIYASQLDAATLDIGQGLELQVLTAVLLGGVSFLGGYGSLFGVLMGVIFIGVLNNGLIVVNINPFIKDVAIGAALFLAAAVDVLYRHLDRLQIPDPDDEPAAPVPRPSAEPESEGAP
jgi:ribose/xylose/arabinose/galactoside ABC-type transport system permease subunit